MTDSIKPNKRNNQALIIFVLCCFICIAFRNELNESIRFGIKLAAGSVIPSLFPFFVISDYLSKNIDYGNTGIAASVFERCFGIPKQGLYAFILGNLCGFPLGVRCAAELYKNGCLSKEECERLCAISNNPSLAFVISVVGASMLKDIFLGVLLYISVLASTFITGIIFKQKCEKIEFCDFNYRQSFSISESIKNAGWSSVSVSSFIVFFSAIIGIVKKIITYKDALAIVAMLLEIGNGALLLTSSTGFSTKISFGLCGFALAFSGFSVHLQAFSFLPTDISRKKYLLIKFIEGVISFVISFLLLFFVF